MNQKELKETLSYDENTGIFIWVKVSKYHNEKLGKTAGGLSKSRGKEYTSIRINKKDYKAHRLAWLYAYGEFPQNVIDHINGDGLDNRLKNLRSVTQLENVQNHKKHLTKKGLPVGVSLCAGGFRARISSNKKTYYLGVFNNPKLASDAYTSARSLLHSAPITRINNV